MFVYFQSYAIVWKENKMTVTKTTIFMVQYTELDGNMD